MRHITITVDLCASVPDDTDLELITLDMDVSKIVIHGEKGPLGNGAEVTSYTTMSVD